MSTQGQSEPLSRRAFLTTGGAALGGLLVGGGLVDLLVKQVPVAKVIRHGVPATKVLYVFPRQPVAHLSAVTEGKAITFDYPLKGQTNMLLKLGQKAEGGVGPGSDVVAFSSFCTHMGCPLDGSYDAKLGVIGPCPCHMSSFDPSRAGMMIIGKADEDLPQVALEVDKAGQIYATGLVGLVYGYRNDLTDGAPAVAAKGA